MSSPDQHREGAWVLAIETSNPSSSAHQDEARAPGIAALRLDDGQRRARVFRSAERHDDQLMPAVAELAGELGLRPSGLTRVCVSIGPGGFTGLRIAITSAKLLASVNGAECVGVPSAEVVAARAEADAPFGVALASKRDTAHLTTFEASGTGGTERGVLRAEDLAALSIRTLVADRFLPETFRAECDRLSVAIREPEFDPMACLERGLNAPPVEPSALLPLYGREPEAVTRWRELHG